MKLFLILFLVKNIIECNRRKTEKNLKLDRIIIIEIDKETIITRIQFKIETMKHLIMMNLLKIKFEIIQTINATR